MIKLFSEFNKKTALRAVVFGFIAIGGGIFAVRIVSAAWTGPTANPPNNNPSFWISTVPPASPVVYYGTGGGKVGIGTSTPSASLADKSLDVAGDINAARICINGVCKNDWGAVSGLTDAFNKVANNANVTQFSAVGGDRIQFDAGSGLGVSFFSASNRVTYNLVDCPTTGQILKDNGSGWICGTDNGGNISSGTITGQTLWWDNILSQWTAGNNIMVNSSSTGAPTGFDPNYRTTIGNSAAGSSLGGIKAEVNGLTAPAIYLNNAASGGLSLDTGSFQLRGVAAGSVSVPGVGNGRIYYDSTNNKFKCWEGGVLKDCITPTGGAATLVQNNAAVLNTVTPIAQIQVAGDAAYRLNLGLDSTSRPQIQFGGGSSQDLRFYRSVPATLTLDNNAGGAANLNVTGAYQQNGTSGVSVAACTAGQFLTGTVAGGIVTSGSCSTPSVSNALRADNGSGVASDYVARIKLSTDTTGYRARLGLDASSRGALEFGLGGGATALDTSIYRIGAGQLRLDNYLGIAGGVDTNYGLTLSTRGVKAESSSATQPAGYFDNTSTGPDLIINGAAQNWPSANSSGILTNNGSGLLTWVAAGASITCNPTCTTNYVPKFNSASTVGNSQIFDNGTNVGIGTTSPDQKLHVQGTLQVGDDLFPGSFINIIGAGISTDFGIQAGGETNPDAKWRIYGNTNEPRLMFDVGEIMVVSLVGGNVGIGTTAPGAKLEVAGQVKITGGIPGAGKVLTSDSVGLATWQTPSAAPATTVSQDSGDAVTNNYVSRIKLASPTDTTGYRALLGLDGSSRGALRFGPGGAGTFDTALYRNSANVLQFDYALTTEGNADPAYHITLNSNLFANNPRGGIKADINESDTVQSNIAAYFSAANSTIGNYALLTGSGNVGIGDTNPLSLLTVGNGDLFQVNSSGNIVKINNITYSWPSLQGGANQVLTNNGSGTLTWAAPSATATQVSRDAVSLSSDYVARIRVGAEANYRAVLGLTSTDVPQLQFGGGGASAPDLTLYRGSSPRASFKTANPIFIDNSYLGVGITGAEDVDTNFRITTIRGGIKAESSSATQPAGYFNNTSTGPDININGAAYNWPGANSSGILTNNGSGLLTWVSAGASITCNPTCTTNYVPKFNSASTVGNSQIFDNGTNVGIGTTGPNLKTQIESATGGLPASSGTTQGAGGRLRLSTGGGTGILDMGVAGATGGWLQMTDSSNLATNYPLLLNPNGGNVGIGITAPGAKLEVAGQVKITGGIPGAGKVLTSDAAGLATWQIPSAAPATQVSKDNGVISDYVARIKLNADTLYRAQLGLDGGGRGALQFGGGAGVYDAVFYRNTANVLQFDYALTTEGNADPAYHITLNANTFTNNPRGGIKADINESDTVQSNIAAYFSAANSTIGNYALLTGSGNVGIGDTNPLSLLTVGNGDLFQVNSSGNIVKINNITYSWPSLQGGANQVLTNNGSGGLTWVAAGACTTCFHNNGDSFTGLATLGTNDAYELAFETGGTEKMRIAFGNVGIGDTTPLSLLTVGNGDLFQVNSTGNLVKINNITYSWPSSAPTAVNQVLSVQTVAGGILQWASPVATATQITNNTAVTNDFLAQIKKTTDTTYRAYFGLATVNAVNDMPVLQFGIGGVSAPDITLTRTTTSPTVRGAFGMINDLVVASAGVIGDSNFRITTLNGGIKAENSSSTSPAGFFSNTFNSATQRGLTVDIGFFEMGTTSTVQSNSTAGRGRIYFNGTKFLVSQNGGAYVDLIPSGGSVTSSGSATYIPKFTTASNIGNSLMYDTGTGIVIGGIASTANTEFEIIGNAQDSNILLGNATGAKLMLAGMTSGVGAVYTMTNHPLYLGANGTNSYVTIGTTGNVGIGTTATPSQKLTVNGTFGLQTTGSNYVVLQGNASQASTTTYTLPNGYATANNQVLTSATSGSGVLTWAAPSATATQVSFDAAEGSGNYVAQIRKAAGATALDTFYRARLALNPAGNAGRLEFGSGTSATDTFLSRSSAGNILVNYSLSVNTINDVNYYLTVWGKGIKGTSVEPSFPGGYFESIAATTPYALITGAGNVGIGDSSPTSLLTVGNGDLFQVNSSGNIVKINNITYSWPSSAPTAVNQVLSVQTVAGGILQWASPVATATQVSNDSGAAGSYVARIKATADGVGSYRAVLGLNGALNGALDFGPGGAGVIDTSIYRAGVGQVRINNYLGVNAGVDTNYRITTSGGGIKAETSTATQSAGYFRNISGTTDGKQGVWIESSLLTMTGLATQTATAAAGQGRIYFDATANKFKVSENGGGYVNLVGGAAISYVESYLASDFAGPAIANTYSNTSATGLSINLPTAGTWLITSNIIVTDNTFSGFPNVNFTAKLWDGVTVESSTQAVGGYVQATSMTLSGIVITSVANTSYRVDVASGAGAFFIMATAINNVAGANASSIRAIKIQ